MHSIDDKRQNELQAQIDSLEARSMEQQATVQRLRRALEQARESDLNGEAAALASGSDKPKPKAPTIERRLDAAQHDAAVYERALTMAKNDLSRYYAAHVAELMGKLAQAKAERAREVAELAGPLLAALRGFYATDDDAKTLRPYLAPPEETGPPGSEPGQKITTVYGGAPMTTQNVFGADRIAGLARGELEQVVAALTNLPASFANRQTREVGS